MSQKYGNITKSTTLGAYSGGYKNVFLFAPRRDFLAILIPDPDPTVIGSSLEIADSHTFTSPKGFHSYDCKTHSVTVKGKTVGDDGAKELEYEASFGILGDSSTTQEQLSALLNDDVICLLKEAACLANDEYVQLGDECVNPTFDVEFDGKTTKEGMKEYTVKVTCKKKYFYTGVVTMAA